MSLPCPAPTLGHIRLGELPLCPSTMTALQAGLCLVYLHLQDKLSEYCGNQVGS